MFKAIGNFLNRIPWWALLLGGAVIIAVLCLMTVRFHEARLEKRARTEEERLAIQREIYSTYGQGALSFADNALGFMQRHTHDPQKQQEFEQARKEINEVSE